MYETLLRVHAKGIAHDDLSWRNITRRGDDIFIIDFSHARIDHDCPGEAECAELREWQLDWGRWR